MVAIVFDRGLQVYGERASIGPSGGTGLQALIQVMSVDDSSTALTAGTTTLGSPTNMLDKAFDATPTRAGQTVSHPVTFTTGEANFTIRRVVLHNDTAANVTGSSATGVSGIDGQALTKTSSFSLKITIDHLLTSA